MKYSCRYHARRGCEGKTVKFYIIPLSIYSVVDTVCDDCIKYLRGVKEINEDDFISKKILES
jgi:hypothetical protein